MQMTRIVLHTSDTDCDGTSFGAHLVSVPSCLVTGFLDERNERMVRRYAQESDQLSTYHDYVEKVELLSDFLAEAKLEGRELIYFLSEGYTSAHRKPSWNPWVYDDTIGTVLDHRLDEELPMAGDRW